MLPNRLYRGGSVIPSCGRGLQAVSGVRGRHQKHFSSREREESHTEAVPLALSDIAQERSRNEKTPAIAGVLLLGYLDSNRSRLLYPPVTGAKFRGFPRFSWV